MIAPTDLLSYKKQFRAKAPRTQIKNRQLLNHPINRMGSALYPYKYLNFFVTFVSFARAIAVLRVIYSKKLFLIAWCVYLVCQTTCSEAVINIHDSYAGDTGIEHRKECCQSAKACPITN
jgi:hypothetical protein